LAPHLHGQVNVTRHHYHTTAAPKEPTNSPGNEHQDWDYSQKLPLSATAAEPAHRALRAPRRGRTQNRSPYTAGLRQHEWILGPAPEGSRPELDDDAKPHSNPLFTLYRGHSIDPGEGQATWQSLGRPYRGTRSRAWANRQHFPFVRVFCLQVIESRG